MTLLCIQSNDSNTLNPPHSSPFLSFFAPTSSFSFSSSPLPRPVSFPAWTPKKASGSKSVSTAPTVSSPSPPIFPSH